MLWKKVQTICLGGAPDFLQRHRPNLPKQRHFVAFESGKGVGGSLGGHGFDNRQVPIRHLTAKALGLGHNPAEVHQDAGFQGSGLGGRFTWTHAGQKGVVFVDSLKVVEILHQALARRQQTTEFIGRLVTPSERDSRDAVLTGHKVNWDSERLAVWSHSFSLPLGNDTHLDYAAWSGWVVLVPSPKVKVVAVVHLEDGAAILRRNKRLGGGKVAHL